MATKRHHHAPGLFVAVVAVAVVFAACSAPTTVTLDKNGVPIGPISGQWIAAQPLSHVYYPGSVPFYTLDSGAADSGDQGPAYAGAILTSNATGAQIYSWHIQTLRSMGWSFVIDKGCADVEVTCPQFGHDGHGNRETFFLAIDDPELLFTVSPNPHHRGRAPFTR